MRGIAANVIPQRFMPTKLQPMRGPIATLAQMQGIYVSEFAGSTLYGFPKNNSGNGPSTCTVSPTSSVNGFGVDNSGNLMVPDGLLRRKCLTAPACAGHCSERSPTRSARQSDASAVSATTGNIAVGNIFDSSGAPGSVSVCTLTSGTCSTNLTNSSMEEVAGVAMAPNGDCWASAIDSSGIAVLIYFAGCSGGGVVTTGYVDPYYGGVDIDNQGNLVTISLFGPSFSLPSQVYVYSGCNPACTLISTSQSHGREHLRSRW